MISVRFTHIFCIFIHNDRLFMVPQTIRAWGAYKGLQICAWWWGEGGALCEIYLITSNKNVKFVLTDLKEGEKKCHSVFVIPFQFLILINIYSVPPFKHILPFRQCCLIVYCNNSAGFI